MAVGYMDCSRYSSFVVAFVIAFVLVGSSWDRRVQVTMYEGERRP
jgi:hypothetical protein